VKWGIPAGDKHLQYFGLPSTIRNGSKQLKQAYLQELIPEEGSFLTPPSRLEFIWRRSVVLDAGCKGEIYDFKPQITRELKEFIRVNGRMKKSAISKGLQEARSISRKRLRWLERAGNHYQTRRMAHHLVEIIEANPCRLLEDEVELANCLGIHLYKYPEFIRVFKSGRVSVSWKATTQGLDDVLRWAILAPPSSGRKRVAVEIWLSRIQDEAESMFERLVKEGLIDERDNHQWWKSNDEGPN
jgi:hypothetical protein